MTFVKGHSYGKRFTSESTSGNKHWNWKGGMPKCKVCSKPLSAKKATYCRKHQFSEKTQEKSHRWIADRTLLKKSERKHEDSAYMDWRLRVYKRDGFVCRMNNVECKGRLEAHHILAWRDFPELRYQLNNGITLCHHHHPRKRVEEKRLSPYFMELVSVSSDLI